MHLSNPEKILCEIYESENKPEGSTGYQVALLNANYCLKIWICHFNVGYLLTLNLNRKVWLSITTTLTRKFIKCNMISFAPPRVFHTRNDRHKPWVMNSLQTWASWALKPIITHTSLAWRYLAAFDSKMMSKWHHFDIMCLLGIDIHYWVLTLKVPNINCSRQHFNCLLKENKAWFFMWSSAEDSLET